MAADVAFGEAMPLVDELERRVGDGVTTATVAAERGMATLRDRQVAALAGALGGLLLTALMLTPLPQGAVPPGTWASRPLTPAAPDAAPVPDVVPLVEPAPVAASQPPPESPVSLDGLNRACAALAKLTEAQALPLVLEQLAAAIGARGVIVWLADSDRRELRAAAFCGLRPAAARALRSGDGRGPAPDGSGVEQRPDHDHAGEPRPRRGRRSADCRSPRRVRRAVGGAAGRGTTPEWLPRRRLRASPPRNWRCWSARPPSRRRTMSLGRRRLRSRRAEPLRIAGGAAPRPAPGPMVDIVLEELLEHGSWRSRQPATTSRCRRTDRHRERSAALNSCAFLQNRPCSDWQEDCLSLLHS